MKPRKLTTRQSDVLRGGERTIGAISGAFPSADQRKLNVALEGLSVGAAMARQADTPGTDLLAMASANASAAKGIAAIRAGISTQTVTGCRATNACTARWRITMETTTMGSFSIWRTSATEVVVDVGGRLRAMTWAELRHAASQGDATLAAVYRDMLAQAERTERKRLIEIAQQCDHAVVETRNERLSTGNVASGHWENPTALGNITVTEVCSCGARRDVNRNGGHAEFGPWLVTEVGNG